MTLIAEDPKGRKGELLETENYRMEWDPATNILSIQLGGLVDEEVARSYSRDFFAYQERNGIDASHKQLVGISGIEKVTREARTVFVELTKESQFARSGLYGLNAMLKALLSFVLYASGRKEDVRVFNSREEALEWLLNPADAH